MLVAGQIPKYKCRKKVHALKLDHVETNPNGSIDIFPADKSFAPINLESDEARRFWEGIRGVVEARRVWKGIRGTVDDNDVVDIGYLVIYEDGYCSWSPTKQFEDDYTRI